MIKPIHVINSIAQIKEKTGASEAQLQSYFDKTLRFITNHTSVEGANAIQLALNETYHYFSNDYFC